MNSRRAKATDSLELLLDTLCNTFGGVLFIAMLVVVMLQLAGDGAPRPSEPVQPDNLRELANELELIDREIETLSKDSHSNDIPKVQSQTGDDKNPQVRLEELLTRLNELKRQIDAKLVETSRYDAETLSQEAAAEALKQKMSQYESEEKTLLDQIEKAQKANARTIQTPVMRRTVKLGLALELRYDRLYVVHQYSRSGERLGPNLNEYVLLSNTQDQIEMTAAPERGIPLVEGAPIEKLLRSRLQAFPPNSWHLDLAVRTGSFGSFHRLKDAARAAGYEMSVLLVPEKSGYRDRGGRERGVQ